MKPEPKTAGTPPPRVVCITQARMGSTRMPGKVLRAVLGRPLLYYHLERLKRCRRVDQVVIATSTAVGDDAIAAFGVAAGIAVVRGPEDDVLARFALAAREHRADVVVRATADCPLIDPDVVDAQVDAWLALGDRRAYVGIDVERLPRGLGAEVFAAAALAEAAAAAADPHEREHVTPYLYRRPERFPVTVWTAPALERPQPLRWCVDEPADFELVRRVLEALVPARPHFDSHDCLTLLDRHPDWMAINQHVGQKT